jgi:hypothetical protein
MFQTVFQTSAASQAHASFAPAASLRRGVRDRFLQAERLVAAK